MVCVHHDRRMEGTWRHNRAYYLCRLADPAEYARSPEIEAEHGRYAYVREDQILPHVERWLARPRDRPGSPRRDAA